jgi:hypothetical protein
MEPEDRAARAQERIVAYLDSLEIKIGHFREAVQWVEDTVAHTHKFLRQSSEVRNPFDDKLG